MKDKNEYGILPKQVKETNEYEKLTESRKSNRKSELNELVLDLSQCKIGIKSSSIGKLKDLLKGITYIKCVKVRGMIFDTANNMYFVLNMLEDMGVIVGDINIEVEM